MYDTGFTLKKILTSQGVSVKLSHEVTVHRTLQCHTLMYHSKGLHHTSQLKFILTIHVIHYTSDDQELIMHSCSDLMTALVEGDR